MIAAGPRDVAAFVTGAIRPLGGGLRVLEVGCGTGYLSLELARAGHAVTAIDPGADGIAIARKTGLRSGRHVDLRETTFGRFRAPAASFDAIVFNLSLHHVPGLPSVMRKTRRLLRAGGRIVVHDFAYDRMEGKTMTWFHEVETLLSGRPGGDAPKAIGRALGEWREKYGAHHLHRYAALVRNLRGSFRQDAFACVPHLFVLLGNTLDRARHARWLPFLRAMEEHRIAEGSIEPLAYRFVGTAR